MVTTNDLALAIFLFSSVVGFSIRARTKSHSSKTKEQLSNFYTTAPSEAKSNADGMANQSRFMVRGSQTADSPNHYGIIPVDIIFWIS